MLKQILIIFICSLFPSFEAKASDELGNSDNQIYMNSQGIVDIMPLMFSFLDKNSIKQAKLVCTTWNSIIQNESFDVDNPHLNLPLSCMRDLFEESLDIAKNPVPLEAQYGYSFSSLIDQSAFNELKIRILLCPSKHARALAYNWIFDAWPTDENTLLFASYIPEESRSEKQQMFLTGFLDEHKKQIISSEDLFFEHAIKSFGPHMLMLVRDEKNPNNDRHPLEIEALKKYKTAVFKGKAIRKCCQVHNQAKKVAETISYCALVGVLIRAYFRI